MTGQLADPDLITGTRTRQPPVALKHQSLRANLPKPLLGVVVIIIIITTGDQL